MPSNFLYPEITRLKCASSRMGDTFPSASSFRHGSSMSRSVMHFIHSAAVVQAFTKRLLTFFVKWNEIAPISTEIAHGEWIKAENYANSESEPLCER